MNNTPWRDSGGRDRPPCKDCPDRYPACSDHCRKPEFLAWKEKKQKITQERMANRSVDSYTVDQIRKNRRGRK